MATVVMQFPTLAERTRVRADADFPRAVRRNDAGFLRLFPARASSFASRDQQATSLDPDPAGPEAA